MIQMLVEKQLFMNFNLNVNYLIKGPEISQIIKYQNNSKLMERMHINLNNYLIKEIVSLNYQIIKEVVNLNNCLILMEFVNHYDYLILVIVNPINQIILEYVSYIKMEYKKELKLKLNFENLY